MTTLLQFVLMAVLVLFIHELGHYLVVLALRLHPTIKFKNFRPSIGNDPTDIDWKNRLIGEAGFGLAFAGLMFLLLMHHVYEEWVSFQYPLFYSVAMMINFWTYPWTNRYNASNDFNKLSSIIKEDK